MAVKRTITALEARELLTDTCALLGRNRFDVRKGHLVSEAQCRFRAELMVHDAFDALGLDFDDPTLLSVFEAGEYIAEREAVAHPGFAAQLDRMAAYCAAHSDLDDLVPLYEDGPLFS